MRGELLVKSHRIRNGQDVKKAVFCYGLYLVEIYLGVDHSLEFRSIRFYLPRDRNHPRGFKNLFILHPMRQRA